MDKEDAVRIRNVILLNLIPFGEMWMDLEPGIQSQKEKNKHRVLMHVCGI